MKNHPLTKFIIPSGFALALALVVCAPVQAQSPMPANGQPMMNRGMADHRQAMMQRCQTMMADMKAQDAEMTAQVAKLNSAPKEQKVDLLAAIVTDLVKQRTAMNVRMQEMQGQMMMSTGKESMPAHSMMNGMGEKPVDATKDQK